ncbi:MAG TPA: glycosyltransferase family 2 protein [Usitatibacter sp.]|nr:glycosyltransferase family 2 protein [Usitatibacter sp.]
MIASVLFLASLALVAYAFAGYPLLAAIRARIAPRPVRRAPFRPNVAIVIVAHNAAPVLARKIESCLAQDYPPERLRVLVASDGSDDATCATVMRFPPDRVQLLAFPHRRGKAACLNDAVAACAEDYLVLTDARQVLEPSAVERLLANFADEDVGAASGELVFEREGMTDVGAGLDAYWRYEKWLRRCESAIHSTVGVTGALYAIRRGCFRPIPAGTILDDVLVPMNVVAQGRRVVFEDGAIAWDRPSTDLAQERTRKVRTLAGNFQLLRLRPALLLPWSHPIALQFVSHKTARLAAPFALALAFAANLWLLNEGPFWQAMLGAQVAGYGCAWIGAMWPRTRRFAPVRLAATFASLNWYVVLGLVEYLTNPGAHLWKGRPVAAEADEARRA